MHKVVRFLSLVFMFLGIGCVLWSVYNLQTKVQSGYLSYSDNSYNTISTIFSPYIHADKTYSSGYNVKDISVKVEKVVYTQYPAVSENIGSLIIPALKQEFPIIQGTGEKELEKGVGHFLQSVLPGEEDNCVLSGHRDTIFSKLGELKIGDLLIVQTSAGIFTYEVDGTRIVLADDRTVIVPTDNAVLTMTTCYPFNYLEDPLERYIVSAILIKIEN